MQAQTIPFILIALHNFLEILDPLNVYTFFTYNIIPLIYFKTSLYSNVHHQPPTAKTPLQTRAVGHRPLRLLRTGHWRRICKRRASDAGGEGYRPIAILLLEDSEGQVAVLRSCQQGAGEGNHWTGLSKIELDNCKRSQAIVTDQHRASFNNNRRAVSRGNIKEQQIVYHQPVTYLFHKAI